MKFGILKYSNRKSLSPIMHNHYMKNLGISGEYGTYSVPPDELESFTAQSRSNQLDGYNVTTPHKEAIVQYMDELSAEADAVGAVNTVAVRKNKLIGHNTDVLGFQKAMNELELNMKNEEVLLFGAGGAARAVVYSLGILKFSVVYVVNRTISRAESLSTLLRNSGSTELLVLQGLESLSSGIKFAINSLSYGVFQPQLLDSLPNLKILYDLNYGTTAFDRSKLGSSYLYSDGMSMLVYQGFESLKFLMQKDLPNDGLTDSAIRKLYGEIDSE